MVSAQVLVAVLTMTSLAGRGSAQQANWSLSEAPLLRIGKVEGELPYLFNRLGNAVRTADGLIAVANGGSNEIRLFGARGEHVRSLGRDGRGPGEFRYLVRVLKGIGDTLVGVDGLQYRASVFTTAGTHVRTETMPVRVPPEALLPDNSYVLIAESGPPGQTGLLNYLGQLLRVRPGHAKVDTLATVPGGQGYWMQDSNGYMTQVELPFRLVLARAFFENDIYTGNGRDCSIAVRDADGRSRFEVKGTEAPRRVTSRDIDRYKEFNLAAVKDENQRRETQLTLDRLPFPESMPCFSSLTVDSEGNLWVERYRPVFEKAVFWDVLDRRGNALAQVRGPDGLRATEIGSDYVLGVQKDDDDVEYVVVYGLRRS